MIVENPIARLNPAGGEVEYFVMEPYLIVLWKISSKMVIMEKQDRPRK